MSNICTHLFVLVSQRRRRVGTSSLPAPQPRLHPLSRSAVRSAESPTSTGSEGPTYKCRPRKTWCAAWSTGSCHRWPETARPWAPWRRPPRPTALRPLPMVAPDTGRCGGVGAGGFCGDCRETGEGGICYGGRTSW